MAAHHQRSGGRSVGELADEAPFGRRRRVAGPIGGDAPDDEGEATRVPRVDDGSRWA